LKSRTAGNGVLVDTTVWIEFLRGGSETGKSIEVLAKADRIVVAGVVIYELTQGIKSEKDRLKIVELLSSLHYIDMSKDLWEAAGVLSRSLKNRGTNLPMSDILLAATALEYKLSLFTLDKHFDSMPEVQRYFPEA
jgi:predicted nucleic acid-binding protein